MSRRALGLAALALVAGGCGGGSSSSSKSNGEASKPPAQVLADAKKAATAASGVHIVGAFVDAGKTIGVDFSLDRDKGKGSMTQDNARADLAVVGSTAYMRASTAFWTKFAGATAAQLLHDRWLKGSATKQPFAGFARIMSINGLIGNAFSSHGKLMNLGEKTYKGQKVVAIKDEKDGSILYVSATGTPYPVAATGGGSVTFSDWDKVVPVTAPKGAVDISSLGG